MFLVTIVLFQEKALSLSKHYQPSALGKTVGRFWSKIYSSPEQEDEKEDALNPQEKPETVSNETSESVATEVVDIKDCIKPADNLSVDSLLQAQTEVHEKELQLLAKAYEEQLNSRDDEIKMLDTKVENLKEIVDQLKSAKADVEFALMKSNEEIDALQMVVREKEARALTFRDQLEKNTQKTNMLQSEMENSQKYYSDIMVSLLVPYFYQKSFEDNRTTGKPKKK